MEVGVRMVLASDSLDPLDTVEGRKAQFRHKSKHMQRNTSQLAQDHSRLPDRNRLSRGGTSSNWCNLSTTLHLVLAKKKASRKDVNSSVNKARCAERCASLQCLISNQSTAESNGATFQSSERSALRFLEDCFEGRHGRISAPQPRQDPRTQHRAFIAVKRPERMFLHMRERLEQPRSRHHGASVVPTHCGGWSSSCRRARSSSTPARETDRFLLDDTFASTGLKTSGKSCQYWPIDPTKHYRELLTAVAPNMDSDVLRTVSPTLEIGHRFTNVATPLN